MDRSGNTSCIFLLNSSSPQPVSCVKRLLPQMISPERMDTIIIGSGILAVSAAAVSASEAVASMYFKISFLRRTLVAR